MRVYFFTFIYFSPYQEGNVCIIFSGEGAENERSCGAIFCQNLGATCTQVKRLWIGIYPWISMDIHGKSVDMDMDGKFHIHGKPAIFGHFVAVHSWSVHCSQRSHKSICLLYTSPSPRDRQKSRMPSSA